MIYKMVVKLWSRKVTKKFFKVYFILFHFIYFYSRTYLLTPILLPIRSIVVITMFVLLWSVSFITLYGLSEEEILHKPFTGWRKKSRKFFSYLEGLG